MTEKLFSAKQRYIFLEMPHTSNWSTFSLGILASTSVHAIGLALLILGLHQSGHEPEERKAIQVELVPPIDEKSKVQPETGEPTKLKPEENNVASADRPKTSALPAMRLVSRFGEKDAGPKKTVDGNATKKTMPQEAASNEPAKKLDGSQQSPQKLDTRKPGTASGSNVADRQRETTTSLHDDESSVAITAMGGVPRGIRAGELCATELQSQLRSTIPPYSPDLLPTYRLDNGTVLQVRKGAFRANARWYNLSFRCEIDEAATRVVSFGFEVGTAVPRAEWASRGFPSL